MEQSSSRSALPTGGFEPVSYMEQSLPPLHEFGNSTSSGDSIRTQIPLPYHLPANYYCETPQQQSGSWDTPVIPNDARMMGVATRSRMNPAIPSWTPTTYYSPSQTPVMLPPLPPATPGPSHRSQFQESGNFRVPRSSNVPYGGTSFHLYQPLVASQLVPNIGQANSSQFNTSNAEGRYMNNLKTEIMNRGEGSDATKSGNDGNPPFTYAASQACQPKGEFDHNFQNMTGSYSQSCGYDISNQFIVPFNSTGQNIAYPNNFALGYSQKFPAHSGNQLVTTNRGIYISDRFSQHEPLKARPVSSTERATAISHLPGVNEGGQADGSTPISKHPAGNFNSEPRPTAETPLLRSRRGQTISSAASDPTRRSSSTGWLEETPSEKFNGTSAGSNTSGDTSTLSQSPPKMRSLGVAGAANGTGALTTIDETDPFVAGPGPLIPFNRGSDTIAAHTDQYIIPFLGGNKTMSTQLLQLTHNGTVKPNIEVVLDQKNLPFVEICRHARPSKAGVIKIRNVSASMCTDM